MQYLVTGCAGFIGSTLTDRLLADGHVVYGIDCFSDYYDPSIKRRNLEQAMSHETFALVEADLCELPLEPLVSEVDGIFHLAAQAGVRASWGSQFTTYTEANVLATQRLLEAAARRDGGPARVVYSSSSSIYGNAESRPTFEDALPRPVSPYGVTKLAGEHLCETYHHNHGLPYAALRYFTVFGPRQRPDMAFHRFLRAAVDGTPISVYGDGTQSRDFTSVHDAVEANVRAMQSTHPAGAYNIGGGRIVSVNEALTTIAELAATTLDIRHAATEAGDVSHTAADTTRAREALGWEPQADFRDTLEAELEWVRGLAASRQASVD